MRTPKRCVTAKGDVRWRVRYRDASGVQTSVTDGSKVELEKFCLDLDAYGPTRAEELLFARLSDDAAPDVIRLDDWVARYIATRSKASPGTREKYEQIWASSFGPEIGHLPIDQVTPEDIARVIIDLSENRGYADKSIANRHGLLAGAMKTAQKRGLILVNPCAETSLPRKTEHESTEANFLTELEYEQLRDVFHPHFHPLIDTVAGTGIRWGEAEALQVRDFSYDAKTLRVDKAVKWHPRPSERKVGPPKTPQSRRTIALPDPVVWVLDELVDGKGPRDLLFTMPRGGALWHRTFWSRYWVPATVEAGLLDPRPRFHDLRHSHASWLISRGVPLTVIQRRLGHSSIKMTSDLYGHLMPDVQIAAAEAAAQVFRGPAALARGRGPGVERTAITGDLGASA